LNAIPTRNAREEGDVKKRQKNTGPRKPLDSEEAVAAVEGKGSVVLAGISTILEPLAEHEGYL
jgi:hypothetical protein